MCNRNLIEEWSWDGSSIDGIKRFAAELGIGLQKFVESFFCDGWPETVPEPYRGVVKGGVSGNPRKFRHSALWNFLGGWSAA